MPIEPTPTQLSAAYAEYNLSPSGAFASPPPPPPPIDPTAPLGTLLNPGPADPSGSDTTSNFHPSAQVMLNPSAPPMSDGQITAMADFWEEKVVLAATLPDGSPDLARQAELRKQLETSLQLDGMVSVEDQRSPAQIEHDDAFGIPADPSAYQVELQSWFPPEADLQTRADLVAVVQDFCLHIGAPAVSGGQVMSEALILGKAAVAAGELGTPGRVEYNLREQAKVLSHFRGDQSKADAAYEAVAALVKSYPDKDVVAALVDNGAFANAATVLRLSELVQVKAARPRR